MIRRVWVGEKKKDDITFELEKNSLGYNELIELHLH